MIKYISFDLDGTIVDFSFNIKVWYEGVAELISSKDSIPYDEALKYVSEEYDKMSDHRMEWYDLGYWFKRFNIDGDWRRLLYKYKDEVRVFPESRGVLEKLYGRVPLILTSNAMREFIEIETKQAGIESYFCRIFSAISDFGTLKGDPKFFKALLKIIDCKPHEIVHVGDHREFDYIIPSSIGIKAFYLDRKGVEKGEYVVRDLSEFGQKVLELI